MCFFLGIYSSNLRCSLKTKTNHLMEKGLSIPHHYLGLVTFFKSTPEKLTYHWKITILNRRYIFKWLFFHCHVSFWGCILWDARFSECHRHPKLRTGILQFHPSSLKEKHFRKKTTQKMAPFSKQNKNGKNIPQNRWGFQEKKHASLVKGFSPKKQKNKNKKHHYYPSLNQGQPHLRGRKAIESVLDLPWNFWNHQKCGGFPLVELGGYGQVENTISGKIYFLVPSWLKTCSFLVYHVYIYIYIIYQSQHFDECTNQEWCMFFFGKRDGFFFKTWQIFHWRYLPAFHVWGLYVCMSVEPS